MDSGSGIDQVWIRSLLFAPGNHPRKTRRVFDFGADAVDLDLEDAVPVSEKSAARENVRAVLADLPRTDAPLVIVRINGPDTGLSPDDLDAAVQPGVFAIHLTKLGKPENVEPLDEIVTRLEAERGIAPGTLRFICSVDSAHLALRVDELAHSSPRMLSFILGGVDFAADLGVSYSANMLESLWIRSYGVLVSRDAGMAPPMHPPVIDFNDEARLRAVLATGKQLGFQGSIAIHPKQVPIIHDVFTPAPEEVARASEIVRRFEESLAAGSSALDVNGQFIDYAVVLTARRILSRSARTSADSGESSGAPQTPRTEG